MKLYSCLACAQKSQKCNFVHDCSLLFYGITVRYGVLSIKSKIMKQGKMVQKFHGKVSRKFENC